MSDYINIQGFINMFIKKSQYCFSPDMEIFSEGVIKNEIGLWKREGQPFHGLADVVFVQERDMILYYTENGLLTLTTRWPVRVRTYFQV